MIWVVRAIMAVGFAMFLLGFVKNPHAYEGEQIADTYIVWFLALLVELVAALLYIIWKVYLHFFP